MILFASGRCDIPAFYAEWFYNRVREGFVDVRNPFNPHQISRILLNNEQIDAILFCTKNPLPMIERLDEIAHIPFMFHITITPYHTNVERCVIDKTNIIEAVKTLSNKIGKERVVLRYDPILLTNTYTIAYHIKAFTSLLSQLQGYIDRCIISFVDDYKNMLKHKKDMGFLPISIKDMHSLGRELGAIGKQFDIQIQTCAEEIDLSMYGIQKGACVSIEMMERLLKRAYEPSRGKAIRNCNCLPTVDIGDYNCCAHYCGYCYANYDENAIQERMRKHDPNASVLIGHINDEDTIHERPIRKMRQEQLF